MQRKSCSIEVNVAGQDVSKALPPNMSSFEHDQDVWRTFVGGQFLWPVTCHVESQTIHGTGTVPHIGALLDA